MTRGQAYCRPGHVTRVSREDRRRLEAAEARYDAVAAEADRRHPRLKAHAPTLAHRDELSEAVTKRRRELGVAAATTQPDHIVDILGALPSHAGDALERWTSLAGRIEAYREEWGAEPQRLTERPRELCQGQAWEAAVHAAQLVSEPRTPVLERGLDRGSGWGCERQAITNSPGGDLDVHGPAGDARGRQGCAGAGLRPP